MVKSKLKIHSIFQIQFQGDKTRYLMVTKVVVNNFSERKTTVNESK